jgi:hypothetical protein
MKKCSLRSIKGLNPPHKSHGVAYLAARGVSFVWRSDYSIETIVAAVMEKACGGIATDDVGYWCD